ncbi:MAG: TIGR02453 family protein [Flavobacteriaceae bacterium]|nr:TIGR02453 family protein [Flavobacteriaceae bacterium]
MQLNPAIFRFFKQLAKNNNRKWFEQNKSEFKALETEVKQFGEALKDQLNQNDSIDRFKVFRIYRDVRFSKDKTPYKTHFGLTWHRTKPEFRGGYYLHLKPDDIFLACGFWDPAPADLKRIRQEIDLDGDEYRNLINAPALKNMWGELQGNKVRTSPKGYAKDHPDIDLLRLKQHIFMIRYTEEEVTARDFMNRLDAAIQAVRPFVDYMSAVLTTNANGESLV